MFYQDHLTKFVLLRALQSKRAEEVAYQLTDIFLTFGAPCILRSDNGLEFVNSHSRANYIMARVKDRSRETKA
jgi:hypothetical protein